MSDNKKMHKRLTCILLIGLVCFTIGVPLLVYKDMRGQTHIINIGSNALRKDESLIFSIDEENTEYGYTHIRGWRLRRGINMDNDFKVALFDSDNSKLITMPTCLEARPDLNKKYNKDKVDYSSAGFYANLESSYLRDNKLYELVFIQDGDKYYNSGVYIKK